MKLDKKFTQKYPPTYSIALVEMAESSDQKPRRFKFVKKTKIENKKEEKVCFKVTLLKKDSRYTNLVMFPKIETRKFVVPNDRSKSLLYLKSKIHSLFEEHPTNGMKIYYKDRDFDYVRVKSDGELIIALSDMRYETNHLFVVAED